MLVQDWLQMATERLSQAGIDSATLEAQLVAAHILRSDRSYLFAHPKAEIDAVRADELLRRRERSEPLAYILGVREFFGRMFKVTPDVLIPRQDTETLVEAAKTEAGSTLLDIGTGSGCIAITLKLEAPGLEVTATDISKAALQVAEENARALGAKVRFLHSDLFENLLGETFDIIASNPPYIGRSEALAPEVADYEPELALFAEDDGLAIYERLAGEAQHHLNDGGSLLLEVGYRQAEVVSELFRQRDWEFDPPIKDLSGIDRVIRARYPWACR